MTFHIFKSARHEAAPYAGAARREAAANVGAARHGARRCGRLADTRGNTLVEAAIITPLMLFLTFSIIDFASLFFTYLSLENGVSQATRYAVTGDLVDDPDHPGAKLSRTDSIITAMRNATPTLTIPSEAFTFSHMPPGAGTWLSGTGGPRDIEKVSIEYTWSFLTPVLRPFFHDGRITLVVDSAMKNEGRFE